MFDFSNIQIFSDFDGTITKSDSVNDFLQKFSGNEWLEVERMWINNEIGSRECLSKQIALIPELDEKIFLDFLDKIEIDEYFVEFYKNFIEKYNVDFYVVSDGFGLFAEQVFSHHNLNIKSFYSNKLIYKNKHFSLEFPFANSNCKRSSGTCKCNVIFENHKKHYKKIYIGDGLSDCCVSDKIDLVFAKKKLLSYCKSTKTKKYVAFNDFSDIIKYFSSY